MNIELAAKIADVIQEHTERWSQDDWAQVRDADEAEEAGVEEVTLADIVYSLTNPEKDPFACSTVGCVAGWACFLGLPPASKIGVWGSTYIDTPDGHSVEIEETAQDLLDLTSEQTEWLFDGYRTQAEVLWALRKTGDWTATDAIAEFWSGPNN
jgi:hypothetical protein